jgi:uncharacterized protein with FMN-binding domain
VRRISYWALSTVSALVLLFGFDASQRGATSTPTTTISGGTSGTRSSGDTGSDNSSRPGSSSGSASSTRTVTGTAAQTQWGPVQVQLKVEKGSITEVSILQYPNGNGRDVEIARYSLPILIRETVSSQSANIDMVSGATYTSTGYIQSLQSALDRAEL